MSFSWNNGLTKETNSSVRKISETMRKLKIDNFSAWREKMKASGKIRSAYRPLKKNGDLAELIGVVLGDGHICIYHRCEELRVISNSKNDGFIKRYTELIEKVFQKKPYVIPSRSSNSTKIGFYEKFISKRLDIPPRARKDLKIDVPEWIFKNKGYVVRYLRGLYEADGSFCVHKQTYTYKFLFSNKNKSMLNNIYDLMKTLDFHPHKSLHQIQISKKEEAYKAMEILSFRDYR